MTTNNVDQFNLERFKSAQDLCYHRVIAELSMGKKSSHWMWYIFPQFHGLGQSQMDAKYSIKSIEEAKALTETDPAIQAGSLVMELHPWYGSAALMKVNELHTRVSKTPI